MRDISNVLIFALGNNVINESHPRICSTSHDVEVSVWTSNIESMIQKSKQCFQKFHKFFGITLIIRREWSSRGKAATEG